MDKGIGGRRWKRESESERLGCRSRELWLSSSLVLKLFIFLLLLSSSSLFHPVVPSIPPSVIHSTSLPHSFPAMDDVHLLLLSFLSLSSSLLFFLSFSSSFSFSFNSFLSFFLSFVWREILV